ncbi:MAG: hypothetical protein ACKV2V_09485 [Blastocatellia bacterium]
MIAEATNTSVDKRYAVCRRRALQVMYQVLPDKVKCVILRKPPCLVNKSGRARGIYSACLAFTTAF